MRLFSGIDNPSRWVLSTVLDEQASEQPDAPWFIGIGGETMSFGQAQADVRCAAGFFAALGVKSGDAVVLMAGNHADFVRAWLGLLSLGAVAVLLNTELRGGFLRHQLASSGATLAVVDAELLPAVEAVVAEAPALARIAVIGAAVGSLAAASATAPQRLDWNAWRGAAPHQGATPREHDIACIMFTSGTSGPAKGVLMPHAHCTLYGIGAIESVRVREGDRWYIVLPLFHANGLLMQLAATLLAGIPAIVRSRFSASAWLADVRAHGATISNCLGALAAFIVATPPGAHDRDHSLRAMCNAPNHPAHEAVFRERFGVADVVSGYGMTEVNIPVWGRLGSPAPGAAGWVSKHFELIVADPETDRELPRGQMGEILVRPRVPWGFMAGYHGLAEKTVEAWRNLWFHTGDAAVMDESGLVTFVDRLKDCIRRRGENIAAGEVENLLATLPGVAEIAACAVPSELAGGEDELMLAIVAAPGTTPDLAALGDAAEALLPRFARPRYLVQVDELPKTATGKVQRATLRKRGSAGAFDRGEPPRASRSAA